LNAAVAATRRVRDRAAFAAFRTGRRGHAGPVRVTWVPGDGAEAPAVAFAVGRRVGSAVARNRVRRQLRAVVAELAPDLAPGTYLVAYRGTADRAFATLRDDVRRAVAGAGARRDGPA
jgi:ribonuclease P protein component